ncbi:type II toxin-antitoxin system HicB family antitoxin [Parafilimonas sp.]|uniref:type II toxin-antitoxin system HicB family antitoxin n=1 Tax=Parafilimonas sp. TaxID=1969739 RepID=UPI0039E48152
MSDKQKTGKTKRIKIIIERSNDVFSAYAENAPGVYGMGDTVEQAKQSAVEGIRLFKKYNKPENIPDILMSDYEVVFKFDTESFLNFYKKIFTNAALERMTGINQKQLQHYASGLKKPRPAQVKKIETAIHNLGKELLAVEL